MLRDEAGVSVGVAAGDKGNNSRGRRSSVCAGDQLCEVSWRDGGIVHFVSPDTTNISFNYTYFSHCAIYHVLVYLLSVYVLLLLPTYVSIYYSNTIGYVRVTA